MVIALILGLAVLGIVGVLLLRPRHSTSSIRRLISEGRLEQARAVLRRVLLRQDRNPELHFLLSRVFEKEYNFDHAVVEQKILLKNGEFGPRAEREEVIERVSRNYVRLGKYPEGLHLLEEEAKKKNSHAVRLWTARLLKWADRNAEAQAILEEIIKTSPGDAVAMTELGSLHLKAGRTTQARESLETALRLDRRSFAAYFHLGEYYRDRKEWDKAVESFENARHDRDLRPSALLNLGRCYRAKEMGKNAIETLERLASEWESDPYYSRIYPSEFIAEARYELAEVYLYDKDYQNALDQWQIIIALIPEFRDVAAKVRANARFGRDRVQDFLITPVGEFERIGLFAMAMVGYGVESRRIEGGERMFLSVRETGKIRGRRLFVAIYRTNNPVGETLLADFDRHMKESGLAEGEVYSATGFTASGMKFVLDRPIRLYGKGQMMKFLKAFENRFHGKT